MATNASRTIRAVRGAVPSANRWRAQWLEDREAELLDTQYFHVVFTVPHEIAAIAYQNKSEIYDILFRAAADTLRTIAADPAHLGAEIGFFGILHTWGQNLHFVVPGGGISPDGTRWIACRPGFFLPVRVSPLPQIVPAVSAEGVPGWRAGILLNPAAPQ